MADNFKISITGLKETQKALYAYSQQLGDRVILGALRQGARVVQKAAQSNAPVGETGKLRRGIRVYKSRIHRGTKSGDMIGVYISIAHKKKDDPYYGRFQEDGWHARGRKTEGIGKKIDRYLIRREFGSRTGRKTQTSGTRVPGKKFIDRAWIEKRAAAVEMIERTAKAAAELLARKMGL